MKFTQPVSMKVTQQQFEQDLKKPLEKLGYRLLDNFKVKDEEYLCTYYSGINSRVSFLNFRHITERGRYFIPTYNPQLFIALSSMSDKPNGILGEYYTNIRRDKFTKKTSETQNSLIIDNIWLKATKEELIAHLNPF